MGFNLGFKGLRRVRAGGSSTTWVNIIFAVMKKMPSRNCLLIYDAVWSGFHLRVKKSEGRRLLHNVGKSNICSYEEDAFEKLSSDI